MRLKRVVVFVIPLVLIVAWVAGARRMKADVEPHLMAVVPGADALEPADNGGFAAYRGDNLVGYARIGDAGGYGGPMRVAVGVDTDGVITGVSIVSHKETTPFFRKVMGAKAPDRFVGRSLFDPLQVGGDIDAVTGATLTSRALVESVRRGARAIGAQQLKRPVPAEPATPVRFGWPEVVLALLFAVGFAGSYARLPGKKPMRWASRLLGLVLLGFVWCIPLSLANINSLLMGYLPDWRTQLYWYLLILGALLPVILTRKHPYCNYVCPFGAAQDCLRAVGGRSVNVPGPVQKWLLWIHGILVFGAILVALYTRNPGPTSYEVYGSLFNLTGMVYQFAVLGVILILSLFVARPWCRFLCPIQAIVRYIHTVRSVAHRRAPAHKSNP
jgi:hypothetical protein